MESTAGKKMPYIYEKISYDNGQWFAHLLIDGQGPPRNLQLFLENAD